MYDQITQTVLRCGQCNKPFDKQSTLKRHGYYCRSRRTGSTIRLRSCLSCARGKSRCDNQRPQCSRCKAKAVECHYPASTPKCTGQSFQSDGGALSKRRKTSPALVAGSPGVENSQQLSIDGDMVLDNALLFSDSATTGTGGHSLGLDAPDLDWIDFLGPQTDGEMFQDPLPDLLSTGSHSIDSTDQLVQVQQTVSSPKVTIPQTPNSAVRSLVQRPKVKAGAQRTATLMHHVLRSYPRTMLRHNALPPFIHPRLLSLNAGVDEMEPLSNCINLMHMISSGVQGSRKLFWKNVRFECERLCDDHQKLNRWELLAAMQALSIYLLTRLDEGETDYNNFDVLLIATVTVIATQLNKRVAACNDHSSGREYGLETEWKDWIFVESLRRLCLVYQAVNMLVYFDPAAMCELPNELVLAPLPAKKQLWEADNAFTWKAETDRDAGVLTAFALAANGELVRLDGCQLHYGDARMRQKCLESRTAPSIAASWEDWCSGMDAFGGLVMLAASLIE